MNDPAPVHITRIIDPSTAAYIIHTTTTSPATTATKGGRSLPPRRPYWTEKQEPISLEKHRRDLNNFVKNHYTYDKSTGSISSYQCNCIHPDNCSLWVHHPNLNDAILEFIQSHNKNKSSDDGRSTTQRNSDIDKWLQDCYDRSTVVHHLS